MSDNRVNKSFFFLRDKEPLARCLLQWIENAEFNQNGFQGLKRKNTMKLDVILLKSEFLYVPCCGWKNFI